MCVNEPNVGAKMRWIVAWEFRRGPRGASRADGVCARAEDEVAAGREPTEKLLSVRRDAAADE